MKKFILILLVSFTTLFSNAAEAPIEVSPAVLKSFNTTFANAREVRWNENGQFFSANFVLDGQHINAYYSAEGEMVALTRNMTLSQLPVMLQADLKNKTGKHNWITGITEYTTDEGTTYYATLENADMKITLRSAGNGEWTSLKKIEKI